MSVIATLRAYITQGLRTYSVGFNRQSSAEYVAPFWNWLFCRMSPNELAARLSATGFRVSEGG